MDGIILINKTKNKTSRDMVNELCHIFDMKKIGHTGTLDPIATGVLVMCLGKYTKVARLIEAIDKEYIATIKLGIKTDTLDITGKVLEKRDYKVSKDDINRVFKSLVGDFKQIVPIYSAKKINGKKLYEYARNNEEVKLPCNIVKIYTLDLIEYEGNIIKFKTKVSKGTYIRSLIAEICNRLDTIGTMADLIRTKQGSNSIGSSFSIEEVKAGNYHVLYAKDFLNYNLYELSDEEYKKVKNGCKMPFNSRENNLILLYNNNEVAIYQKNNDEFRPIVMLI